MKKLSSNFLKKIGFPALFAGVALLAANPAGALAQNRGGGHGGGYSGGRQSYSGGGRSYGGGERSYGGRSFVGGGHEGHDYDRGRGYYGGRYYGGGSGIYFGFGGGGYGYDPYYYAPAAPAAPACGYYDRWGYWHAYPGCYVSPYGY